MVPHGRPIRTMKLPTLLLTSSAIAHDTSVKLIDTASRIEHTLESIEHWRSIAPHLEIVVCDGSGHDFGPEVQQRFPGHPIECLAFENDRERVARQGKGYGEGEIIRFALKHSTRLQRADSFIKCTGKLWVTNVQDCLAEWQGGLLAFACFENVFSMKPSRLAYIDTRFYIVDKGFYHHHLEDAHLDVGGSEGLSIEDCFRDVILNRGLTGVLFRTLPEVHGVGGGSGTYYKNNLRRRLKGRLRQRLVQNRPEFAALFNSVASS